jgi:hypothetical protein
MLCLNKVSWQLSVVSWRLAENLSWIYPWLLALGP